MKSFGWFSDVLTVTFEKNIGSDAGICISRKVGEETKTIKMDFGEQADILYRLLTEQMLKAKII